MELLLYVILLLNSSSTSVILSTGHRLTTNINKYWDELIFLAHMVFYKEDRPDPYQIQDVVIFLRVVEH